MNLIEDLIIKIDKIFDEYIEDGGGAAVPVDLNKIRKIIEKNTGLKIIYQYKDWESSRVKGCLIRYEDKAIIQTLRNDKGLNDCWTRFIRCKEIGHLILDGVASYTDNIEQLVHELVEVKVLAIDSSPAAKSEALAEMAAIELLFPMAIRGQFKDMIVSEGFPVLEVAKILRIPVIYVERAISKSYEDNIDSVHRELVVNNTVNR